MYRCGDRKNEIFVSSIGTRLASMPQACICIQAAAVVAAVGNQLAAVGNHCAVVGNRYVVEDRYNAGAVSRQ